MQDQQSAAIKIENLHKAYAMSTSIFVMIGWVVVALAITIRFFRWD